MVDITIVDGVKINQHSHPWGVPPFPRAPIFFWPWPSQGLQDPPGNSQRGLPHEALRLPSHGGWNSHHPPGEDLGEATWKKKRNR